MASIREKAKKYGLRTPGLEILYAITLWFNGHSIEVSGETKHIATTRPPALRELLEAWDREWTTAHVQAHQQLRRNSVLDERWICGRKIEWAPTENALTIIRDLFKEDDAVRPRWADKSGGSPPLYGDPNELLLHRTGVEIAAHAFGTLPWVDEIEYYHRPDFLRENSTVPTPDLMFCKDGGNHTQVEVLTDNNNRDTWTGKWDVFAEDPWNVIWVFENRTVMVQFFNHIYRERDKFIRARTPLVLHNGEMGGDPGNWSPHSVNQKLMRSRKAGNNNGAHLAWTIPGLLRADSETVEDWFDKYEIII